MPDILSLLDPVRGIAFIILFLGGSIFVHELGHFLAAKWRGLKVERFSIGFGPRVFGWTGKDGVDYRISLLPLGGYVALPQLADMEAIEGKSTMKDCPRKEISYLDKIIVFAAGAFFNILFALLCAIILWIIKIPTTTGYTSNVIGGVEKTLEIQPGEIVPAPAFEAGIRPGDKIISIDGEPTENFEQIVQAIALGSGRSQDGKPLAVITIEREGKTLSMDLSPRLVSHNPRSGDFIRAIGITPRDSLTVNPLHNSRAEQAGIQNSDKLISCDTHNGNGQEPLFSISQLNGILKSVGEKEITLLIQRGDKKIPISVTPKIEKITWDLAYLRFQENGKTRTIKFLSTPQNLDDFPPKTPRNTLRVLEALPQDSDYAKVFLPGSIIDGVSLDSGKIMTVKTPAEFGALSDKKAQSISVFLTTPDNSAENATFQNATIGIIPPQSGAFIGVERVPEKIFIRKTPWTQFKDVWGLMIRSVTSLVNPKSDIGVGHLNSVITISETYYAIAFDIRLVLGLTVLLNINLAFLNLLPLPILDGGHILIETIQRLRRKRIPQSAINIVQYVFMIIFLLFMGFILMKDFARSGGTREMKAASLVAEHQYRIFDESNEETSEAPVKTVPAEK